MNSESVIIRQAKTTDIEKISRTHAMCFGHGFTSSLYRLNYKCLGGDLAAEFYLEYLKDFPELFIVAESDGNIVGFCMGYYLDKRDQLSRFIKHNAARLLLKVPVLLLMGDKSTWKKTYQVIAGYQEKQDILSPLPDTISKSEISDILSICVLPEFRGLNIASKLVVEFMKTSKEHHCKACLLTVEDDNLRAMNFYKRMGFVVYSTKINKKGYKKML